MAQPEFIQVQNALGGISYPATKNQLIEHARSRMAGKDTLEALQHIPEREYGGPDDVSAAVANEQHEGPCRTSASSLVRKTSS